MTGAADLLAWLAARPGLFTAAPPIDLSRCNSCLRTPTVLLVSAAPGGAYAYCLQCRGPDRAAPTATRPARTSRVR